MWPGVPNVNSYLIQNSQAVKKVCGPQKGYGEKRCEIQGGGQEMAVMVKILITTIQVNFVPIDQAAPNKVNSARLAQWAGCNVGVCTWLYVTWS